MSLAIFISLCLHTFQKHLLKSYINTLGITYIYTTNLWLIKCKQNLLCVYFGFCFFTSVSHCYFWLTYATPDSCTLTFKMWSNLGEKKCRCVGILLTFVSDIHFLLLNWIRFTTQILCEIEDWFENNELIICNAISFLSFKMTLLHFLEC